MNVPWSECAWRRALIYGLGRSGVSAAQLLLANGVEVLGYDRRPAADLELTELNRAGGFETLSGDEPRELPPGIDGIVVSPGVPTQTPLLEAARGQRIPVVAEVELAFPFLNGPLLGITGSNGKSTTTALTGALLADAGYQVEVCGNIGRPLCSCLEGPPGRIFVAELSSFQLESVDRMRPHVAALLNFSADHLDRHGDEAAYLAAKTNIFRRQDEIDFAVLNADDPNVREIGVRARRRYFSRLGQVADGCYLEGEQVVEVGPDQESTTLFKGRDLSLTGTHNLENAMAAALLARCVGAASDTFPETLAEFRGLPHRSQRVDRVRGVLWIDDSKSTNVGATVKSVEGFPDGSIHLILGGRNKGADLSVLREPVGRKARRVYLIGEASDAMHDALNGTAPLEPCETMQRAVTAAAANARDGETVLLAPACASFDQYSGYEERGDHFQRLVNALGTGEVDG